MTTPTNPNETGSKPVDEKSIEESARHLIDLNSFVRWNRDRPSPFIALGFEGVVLDHVTRYSALRSHEQPPLWCLHIEGPDDVHPAPSKAHAEVAAKRFNDYFRGSINNIPCRAVVEAWPHSAESHAETVAEFCARWLVPVEQPSAPYSLDADPLGIRAYAADAITGARTYGAQNTNPPPAGHWLTPFWEMARAEVAAKQPSAPEPVALSPHSRAMLLNVLWHHQGGSSAVGQPLRSILGIGQHDHLDAEQVNEAKRIDGLLANAVTPPAPRESDLSPAAIYSRMRDRWQHFGYSDEEMKARACDVSMAIEQLGVGSTAPREAAQEPIAWVPQYKVDTPQRSDFSPGDFDWMSVQEGAENPFGANPNWQDVPLYLHPAPPRPVTDEDVRAALEAFNTSRNYDGSVVGIAMRAGLESFLSRLAGECA